MKFLPSCFINHPLVEVSTLTFFLISVIMRFVQFLALWFKLRLQVKTVTMMKFLMDFNHQWLGFELSCFPLIFRRTIRGGTILQKKRTKHSPRCLKLRIKYVSMKPHRRRHAADWVSRFYVTRLHLTSTLLTLSTPSYVIHPNYVLATVPHTAQEVVLPAFGETNCTLLNVQSWHEGVVDWLASLYWLECWECQWSLKILFLESGTRDTNWLGFMNGQMTHISFFFIFFFMWKFFFDWIS